MLPDSPTPSGASKQSPLPVWLFGACILAAGGCGWVLGAGYAYSSAWGEQLETPLGRIGYRMTVEKATPPEDFPSAKEDLAAAQRALGQSEGQMLRLIVTLRKPEAHSTPDLNEAAAVCRALVWPRSDEVALRRMQEALKK